MIVLTEQRDTKAWREAHRGKISASDARAIMAAPGTKARAKLVERLVLDFENVEDHRYDEPDRWHVRHEEQIRTALASYRITTSLKPCGLLQSSVLPWLVASPHAVVGAGVVLFRPHQTLRAFTEKQQAIDRAWRVRTQLTLFVAGAQWCDVVDYLDGAGLTTDRQIAIRVYPEKEWLYATVIPTLVGVWAEVQRQLEARKR